MFVQLHALTSYSSVLLNRDQSGFPKKMPFGNAVRTRVSSQCLKHHWRNHDGKNSLKEMDIPKSLRSRETFYRRVVTPLAEEYPEAIVATAARALQELVFSGDTASLSDLKNILTGDEDPEEMLKTGQVTTLGVPEVRYIRGLVEEKVEEVIGQYPSIEEGEVSGDIVSDVGRGLRDFSESALRENLKALEHAMGLSAALFGRMATSDILARGDGALHVAHAITTHGQQREPDFFSAVDELRKAEEGTAQDVGHVGSKELTSGLFYSYVTIDIPLLVSNLSGVPREKWEEGNTELAAEVVRRFTQMLATVSPGAKLGSTAPHSYAWSVLGEVGTEQPRSLSNAFLSPASENNLLEDSYEKLGKYVESLDQMYGTDTDRRLAAMGPTDGLAERVGTDGTTSVPEMSDWIAQKIRGGQ